MTKEELREKRNLAIENLNYAIAILGSDELCIDQLEKENAELKDYRLTTLAKQQTENQKYTVNLEHKLSWYDDQLTKAKEIIKTFLGFAEAFGYSPSMDKFITEAKQFLKEVSE